MSATLTPFRARASASQTLMQTLSLPPTSTSASRPMRRPSLSLRIKLHQLKARLEESENKLLEFAQERQIVDITDKTSIAETNLASANAALGNLISERTKNEQLWQQVEAADAVNIPQLLSNSVIDGLRKQRNDLLIEYQEKLQTFKPGYPDMVRLNARDQRNR